MLASLPEDTNVKLTRTNNLTGETTEIVVKPSRRSLERYTEYFSKSREGTPFSERK